MSDKNLIEEIENEFELPENDSWNPDISLSGTGDDFSETFELPGGLVIVEITLENNKSYEINAVSESGEDRQLTWNHQSISSRRRVANMGEGTYILDVECRREGSWEINFYLSAPDPRTLPVSESGSEDDFIGPVNYSGFIKLEATNYDDSSMRVSLLGSDGTGYASDEVMSLGSKEPAENSSSSTAVASNQDGGRHLPWIQIRSDGQWELNMTAHN